ncbi:hypothetical protein [Haloarchaeobius sp. HRN-SO-5]|uniref:hypothetical protein n=1 Tax=Haloarchaeobius sp. HRN-SO-5 TaxID=3446118 RepID=UPI003EC12917
MSVREFRDEVPNWKVGVGSVVVLFAASLVYGVIVRGSVLELMIWWIQILEFAAALFVIYLFYRLVVAVETIANET